MINIPVIDAQEARLWHALLDLAEANEFWTLIGARMVQVHAAKKDRRMPRLTADADVLADARQRPNPVRAIAEILARQGFELTDASAWETGHIYEKDGVRLDILAPDGLGVRSAEARTTTPPLRTLEVPGGSQALTRTVWEEVQVQDRMGRLPCPNLLGAILIKARAVGVHSRPEDQRRDLALLLSLVDDPRPLLEELSRQERSWLRARAELDDEDAPYWATMSETDAQQGLAAYRMLTA